VSLFTAHSDRGIAQPGSAPALVRRSGFKSRLPDDVHGVRIERMYHPSMLRRCVLMVALVVVLGTCGGDDDDDGSGGPAREGTSGEWADAWTRVAEEGCGGQCAVFSARDEGIPAAEAEPSNFNVRYDPTEDPEAEGWADVQDFADEVGCVLPEQPVVPTPINCAAG
jgi:hypothetical protein